MYICFVFLFYLNVSFCIIYIIIHILLFFAQMLIHLYTYMQHIFVKSAASHINKLIMQVLGFHMTLYTLKYERKVQHSVWHLIKLC